MIKKGTFVEIETLVLDCPDRSPAIPEDTKKTQLKMWVRGFVNSDCEIGDEVGITTAIDRTIQGKVVEIEPGYNHDFGRYVNEISYIGKQAKDLLKD